MGNNVLITGGTGLVGSLLTQLLIEKGYQVSHLSRRKRNDSQVKTYQWDIRKGYIEEGALKGIDHIIHLSGAGVADKKWTKKYKKEIFDSRVNATKLLFQYIRKNSTHIRSFVAASAIGIYPNDNNTSIHVETSAFGNDFLAEVTKSWEAAIDEIKTLNIKVVKLRIGVVLSNEGGALQKMIRPVKMGLGAPLASGGQYMSWIHIEDLCRLFIEGIENAVMEGAYNAVAPEPVTNRAFSKKLAKVLKKPFFLPNIPAFFLKLLFGEMSSIIIHGSNVSSEKLVNLGFRFKFHKLESALIDLLKK